jgi:ketosteroid isomerase-like protein
MADNDHPNVDFIRRGFDALAAGDLDTVTNQFSPDLRYYGADQFGRPREMQSRDELFGVLLAAMERFDEYDSELVDAYAVGDEIVMAQVRLHRRRRDTGASFDTDIVMVFRVEEGAITRGVDLLDSAAETWFGQTDN